jgi:hypothetical protein
LPLRTIRLLNIFRFCSAPVNRPPAVRSAETGLPVDVASIAVLRPSEPELHLAKGEGMSFRLAVCAEMVYGELPLIERVERIHEQGFEVKLWDTRGRDTAQIGEGNLIELVRPRCPRIPAL